MIATKWKTAYARDLTRGQKKWRQIPGDDESILRGAFWSWPLPYVVNDEWKKKNVFRHEKNQHNTRKQIIEALQHARARDASIRAPLFATWRNECGWFLITLRPFQRARNPMKLLVFGRFFAHIPCAVFPFIAFAFVPPAHRQVHFQCIAFRNGIRSGTDTPFLSGKNRKSAWIWLAVCGANHFP